MEENKPQFAREVLIKDAKKIIGLKSMAYKEYQSARLLLNSGMLHQAAIFINTCLEKELKAFLFAANIEAASTHDTFKLFNLASQVNNIPWIKLINPEFIKVITKIYKSRYYEGLGPGYNFVINRNKFLAELDFTYTLLDSKTIIKSGKNPDRESNYYIDVANKNPILFQNNYILNNIDKDVFLNQPDTVYEFRITATHHSIEIIYLIPKNIDLKKFNYEGLKQKDNQNFILSQGIKIDKNGV
jgi:HEPN domain-containing protein